MSELAPATATEDARATKLARATTTKLARATTTERARWGCRARAAHCLLHFSLECSAFHDRMRIVQFILDPIPFKKSQSASSVPLTGK